MEMTDFKNQFSDDGAQKEKNNLINQSTQLIDENLKKRKRSCTDDTTLDLNEKMASEELFKCPLCNKEGGLVVTSPHCGKKACFQCIKGGYYWKKKYEMEDCGSKSNTTFCIPCLTALDYRIHMIDYGIETRLNVDKLKKPEIQKIFPFICGEGNIEKVKYCVEEIGVNLDEKETSLKCTPLSRSVSCGQLEIVKYLLEKGAKLNQKRKDGMTLLMIACGCEKNKKVDLEIVKYLVEEKGANIHEKGPYGETLVHISSLYGHLDIVKYLVEQGVNANTANSYERTPLHASAAKGYLEIVKFLVEQHGADVNKRDEDLHTPLGESYEFGQPEVWKYLKEKGAEYDSIEKIRLQKKLNKK